jgi:hypothetical protein
MRWIMKSKLVSGLFLAVGLLAQSNAPQLDSTTGSVILPNLSTASVQFNYAKSGPTPSYWSILGYPVSSLVFSDNVPGTSTTNPILALSTDNTHANVTISGVSGQASDLLDIQITPGNPNAAWVDNQGHLTVGIYSGSKPSVMENMNTYGINFGMYGDGSGTGFLKWYASGGSSVNWQMTGAGTGDLMMYDSVGDTPFDLTTNTGTGNALNLVASLNVEPSYVGIATFPTFIVQNGSRTATVAEFWHTARGFTGAADLWIDNAGGTHIANCVSGCSGGTSQWTTITSPNGIYYSAGGVLIGTATPPTTFESLSVVSGSLGLYGDGSSTGFLKFYSGNTFEGQVSASSGAFVFQNSVGGTMLSISTGSNLSYGTLNVIGNSSEPTGFPTFLVQQPGSSGSNTAEFWHGSRGAPGAADLYIDSSGGTHIANCVSGCGGGTQWTTISSPTGIYYTNKVLIGVSTWPGTAETLNVTGASGGTIGLYGDGSSTGLLKFYNAAGTTMESQVSGSTGSIVFQNSVGGTMLSVSTGINLSYGTLDVIGNSSEPTGFPTFLVQQPGSSGSNTAEFWHGSRGAPGAADLYINGYGSTYAQNLYLPNITGSCLGTNSSGQVVSVACSAAYTAGTGISITTGTITNTLPSQWTSGSGYVYYSGGVTIGTTGTPGTNALYVLGSALIGGAEVVNGNLTAGAGNTLVVGGLSGSTNLVTINGCLAVGEAGCFGNGISATSIYSVGALSVSSGGVLSAYGGSNLYGANVVESGGTLQLVNLANIGCIGTSSTGVLQAGSGCVSYTQGVGISISGSTIANTGVLSVNGSTGAITIPTYSAGTGININGSGVISNNGVLSVNGAIGAVSLSAGPGVSISGTSPILISIGQSVATSATPNFGGLQIGGTSVINGSGYYIGNVSTSGIVWSSNTSGNAIQSTGGFNSTGSSTSGYAYSIGGSGIISNSGGLFPTSITLSSLTNQNCLGTNSSGQVQAGIGCVAYSSGLGISVISGTITNTLPSQWDNGSGGGYIYYPNLVSIGTSASPGTNSLYVNGSVQVTSLMLVGGNMVALGNIASSGSISDGALLSQPCIGTNSQGVLQAGTCGGGGGGPTHMCSTSGSSAACSIGTINFGSVYRNSNSTAEFVNVSAAVPAGGVMIAYADSGSSPSVLVLDQYNSASGNQYMTGSFVVLPNNYFYVYCGGCSLIADTIWW